MPSLTDKFLWQPLRALLIKILSWTERKESGTAPRARKTSFWRQEVHLPTWLVAFLVGVFLFVTLFLEVGFTWPHALGLLILTGLLLALFVFYIRRDLPQIAKDDEAVLLLGLLVLSGVMVIEIWGQLARARTEVSLYGIPLAATSLLTAVLLHPRLAIIVTVVMSLVFGLMNNFSLEVALVACFGGVTGVARALSVRTRGDVTRAGLWVGMSQALILGVVALFQSWPWQHAASHMAWALGGGLLSSLVALSVLPSLENFFSRPTNIKLLEMADVNHPLLKRMSIEAPGTYHHSLVMASLAEAAAESIGANGLLCRVGAYFHDIGKMAKPEYFVENQGALGNPHDPLPPNMSRLVIQSHVKEGLALARQYNLDPAIAEFIPMHHGTSRIEYFYRRAIERSDNLEEVGEDEYRYPGPKPHTKETAIVMLSDSVEASVRTIEEPTHQRIQDQVQKIINTKVMDGQFSDVPLTLADLAKISESFVNTLTGIYHSRIKYPEALAQASPEQ